MKNRCSQSRIVLVAIVALLPALCATTGSVSGVVKDTSGAAITGARITLTSTSMGIKSSTTTSKAGTYNFPTVLPGQYDLHAEAKGFKPQNRAVVVHVDGRFKIDLTMESE